ncbi:MAG: nucleotidyltransferase domain-containing protein [Bacteroidota bacterium]
MPEIKNDMALDQHVIKTLLYYDIFNYPLRVEEIVRFLGTPHHQHDIQWRLNELAEQGFIFKFGDLFSIQNNIDHVSRRLKGNEEAQRYLPLAKKMAKLISRFPFVRAVMASGSLSKNYMDENCDLDFFIVTETGRLWVTRMLLVLYKRIFLFNSHKHFCVNYFVDTHHLEIEEKNLFTATELATVLPLQGVKFYHELHAANPWVTQFFPNLTPRSTDAVEEITLGGLKKVLENIMNFCFGDRFENFFMNLTLNRWKRKYQRDYPNTEFQIAFKTKKYTSKSHPRNFQRRVMDTYKQKLEQFSQKFDRVLNT